MPTKIRVLNGPGFRDMHTYGPMSSTGAYILHFKVGRWLPKGEVPPPDEKPRDVDGRIAGIIMNHGDPRNVRANLAHEEKQVFSIILRHNGMRVTKYLVFRYDLSMRTGEGMEFTEEEFMGMNGIVSANSPDSACAKPVNAVASILLSDYDNKTTHLGFDYERELVGTQGAVVS